MYLTGYGIGRFWIEGLSVDQLQIGNTGLAVSQILAAAIGVIALSVILYKRNSMKKKAV
jgi:phosphatidylglycerol:prolipoprotein diacylglycerol transferase